MLFALAQSPEHASAVALQHGAVVAEWSGSLADPLATRVDLVRWLQRQAGAIPQAEAVTGESCPDCDGRGGTGAPGSAVLCGRCGGHGRVPRPRAVVRVATYGAGPWERLPWQLGYWVSATAHSRLEWVELREAVSAHLGAQGKLPEKPEGGWRCPKLAYAAELLGVREAGEARLTAEVARAVGVG